MRAHSIQAFSPRMPEDPPAKCEMAHISGDDRSQLLLLPEPVDDYVGPDNVVRFIEAFVDGLDLQAAGFVRVKAKAPGRSGCNPADLLKLYIYGYLNRVRSSRRLAIETRRNIEVIWLLRRLTPDFKTIADFRRENRPAFRLSPGEKSAAKPGYSEHYHNWMGFHMVLNESGRTGLPAELKTALPGKRMAAAWPEPLSSGSLHDWRRTLGVENTCLASRFGRS